MLQNVYCMYMKRKNVYVQKAIKQARKRSFKFLVSHKHGQSRGEFSRLVMRCVKWDGYITRFLGMLGLESLFMKEER